MPRTPREQRDDNWVDSVAALAVSGRRDPGGVAETQKG